MLRSRSDYHLGQSAAIVSVAVAAALTWSSWPFLRPTPMVLLYAAVLVSARLGGARGGVLVIVLSAALGYFAFLPARAAYPADLERIAVSGVFLFVASAMVRSVVAEQSAARREARQRQWFSATLSSVGDAVIATDIAGRVTFMNPVAERLAGWAMGEAAGREFEVIFDAYQEGTGARAESPARRALASDASGKHADDTILLSRDGTRTPIEDSASRILDHQGNVLGAVLVFRDATERRASLAASEALRLSEERFRTAERAANIGTFDWDLRSDEVEWSAGIFRSIGMEPGAARPTLALWLEHVHPDDREPSLRAAREAIASGREYYHEFRIIRPGGEVRWLASTGRAILDDRGEPARFVGVNSDITTRKRAEERMALLADAGKILGSSLHYERTLADVCRLAISVHADWCTLDLIDGDGGLRRVEVAHADPEKVALANEYRERYPPDPRSKTGLMHVIRTGRPELHPEITDEQLRAGAADKEHYAWLKAVGLTSAIVVPLIARGRTLGALTLVSSTSGRRYDEDDLNVALELAARSALAVDNARLLREAEEAARRREEVLVLHRAVEEQLLALVRASGLLSASLETEAVLDAILSLSRTLIAADAYAIWRFDRARGRWEISSASGLPSDYRAETIDVPSDFPEVPDEPIVSEDVRTDPRMAARRAYHEREGIASMLVVPLRVGGRTDGTISFYFRTPQRFGQVETRVATALANLASSAIQASRLYGELKENDRKKDEFLAMLAHELRNPLAAIGNAVTLTAEGGVPAHGDWAMEVIARQLRHLSRLIDDLLDVSRINQGKIWLRRKLVELTPSLEGATVAAGKLIEERGHTLEVEADRGDLWAFVDPTRIEQVVTNLLNNAAKYSENGGHIRLTARAEGREVVISVRDRGIGIAPEKLPQMFDLFTQGDRTLARSEGGLGIGLTVVKKLVEMHGGSIEASSEGIGLGSAFCIRLPRAEPPVTSDAPKIPPPVAASGALRILIVEDNEDAARAMARLLILKGHHVTTVFTGPEAIEIGRATRPQVILLDIGLPGMDGYVVAAALRRDDACRDAVLVAISGYGQPEDRRRSREAGFDHHLVKPIEVDRLLRLLAEASAGATREGIRTGPN